MRIVISGASGLIGTALSARLRADGHSVVALVRRQVRDGDEVEWDPGRGSLDPAALEGAGAVINLSGAGIGDKRWTDDYKQTLRQSRLQTTSLLAARLAEMSDGPKICLSGSAIGIYGERGDEELDESSAPGDDFLAGICKDWEGATGPANAAGIRVAHLRTGIVLSTRGGALKKQLPLFKLGLGGTFGSGRQWQSWIGIDDEVGAIAHLLTIEVEGPVNLTAPHPVTSKEFTTTLAKVLKRPAFLPIPSFAPKLVLGGELVEALLLSGQKVLPQRLQESGYQFRHPDLESALRALLDNAA